MGRMTGLEPPTNGLEGRCSIQLSYRRPSQTFRREVTDLSFPHRLTFKDQLHKWSGREDLNLRPPVPKTGALPGCATPRYKEL